MALCTSCKREQGFASLGGLCANCYEVGDSGTAPELNGCSSPPHTRMSGTRRLKSVLLSSGPIAATLLFWATYSGPYQWLAEWQLGAWGRYFPALTLLGTLLVIYVPIAVLLSWIMPKDDASSSGRLGEEFHRAQPEEHHDRRSALRVPGWLWPFLGFGVLGVVGGSYYGLKVWTAGPLVRGDLEQIADGSRPASRNLQVSGGRLVRDAGVGLSKRGNDPPDEYYVPYVSQTWRPGRPVHVYVQVHPSDLDALAPADPIRGLVTWTGLPGPVQLGLEEGPAPPGDDYYVLDTTLDVEAARKASRLFFAIGAVLLAVFFPLWWIASAKSIRGDRH